MKKLFVKSLPLKDVIADLAKEMNCDFSEDCDVFSIEIPEAFGNGNIVGINFISGLGVILYDCVFIKDVRIFFNVNSVHPVKFLYAFSGKIEHKLEEDNEYKLVAQHQSMIVASSKHNGHVLHFYKDQRVQLCSLEIDRFIFMGKMRCNFDGLDQDLKLLLEDVSAVKAFYYEGNYSLQLYDTLSDIGASSHFGIVRRLFLQSLTSNLLFQQIVLFEEDRQRSPEQHVMRQSEIEIVKEAALLIRNDLEHPKNIDQLARRLGTNSNKLQAGFRLLYGNTINGFMKEERLTIAREMLVNTDNTISEIVIMIGLANRGYFSRLFKEKYGESPQRYRIISKLAS